MATLSTSTVESLTDNIIGVERRLTRRIDELETTLKADINKLEGRVNRLTGKVDMVLELLQELRAQKP